MRGAIARINWLWRLLATLLCFALFGVGSVLLSLCWFRLLSLWVRPAEKRKGQVRLGICWSFRVFLWVSRRLGVLDFHVEGAGLLQRDTGCLVVANHPTLLDYMLLVSLMPRTDCLVKSALLNNPFVSGVIRAADYLLNSQAEKLLPLCQQRLAQGETILIFPEGTRSRVDQPMVLQRGAANIAVRCGCDVRMVTIRCSEPFLNKTNRWYQVPASRPVFHIKVGERFSSRDISSTLVPSLAARQLNRHFLHAWQEQGACLTGK